MTDLTISDWLAGIGAAVTSLAVSGMTVNDWLGVIGAVVTVIFGVSGGAWWMASLHAMVRSLATIAAEMREEVKALRQEMHGAHDKLWDVVRDHEHRIDRLEAKSSREGP